MSTVPDTRNRMAARYITILHDPDATLEMVEDALAWADCEPGNRAALERAQRVLDLCDQQPELGDGEPLAPARYSPASAHRWLVAACLVLAIAMLAALKGPAALVPAVPETASDLASVDHYATAIGETRTVLLPDGSSVVLGGLTKLSVGYAEDVRRLELVEGQALFNVAKDRKRPFVVRSGAGVITARGTEFDIKRDADVMTVTLVHGIVDVGATDAARPREVRLQAGMQVQVLPAGRIGRPGYVDVGRVLAWRSGQLKYEDEKLSTIVADLNRYSARPITINDEAVRAIRVSGSVRTTAIENWLAGLATAFDIRVDRSSPAVIQLKSNRGNATRQVPQ